jgi:transcriptional regulator with XRE-family HTH domain
MYHPLHEADMQKFVDVANSIIFQKETNLARYRKNADMSQIQLSRYSQVSLRSIQLYEQRQLNINTAPANKLLRLSRVLGCSIEDLLEVEGE